MWLSSLKVLGWAIGRGPLMTAALTLPQFVAVAFLPITPVLPHSDRDNNNKNSNGTNGKQLSTTEKARKGNARQDEKGDTASAAAVDFFFKLFCLALLLTALQKDLPRLAREVLYAFGLYLFIAIIMDCVGFISVLLLNLQVAPHFDRPFLSASLTDYWSRRWNLNTGYTMRFLIYDPICERRLIKKVGSEEEEEEEENIFPISRRRRAVAVCISFLVSGIFHEFFIIYLRGRISGYWLTFFTVQGPLLVFESTGRRWMKLRGVAVPRVLSIPLTLGILFTLGDLLFFPSVRNNGIAEQVVQNLYGMLVPGSIASKVE
ncbi:hypothetical protein Ndes2526A_g05296 [Nannochloris sp. 'desiccata']